MIAMCALVVSTLRSLFGDLANSSMSSLVWIHGLSMNELKDSEHMFFRSPI